MIHARPPAMTLAGVEARHAWLDRRMRVSGYDPIQSPEQWRDANVLLGAAVHAVIKHLQLNPPEIVRFVDQGLISIQTKTPSPAQLSGTQTGGGSSGSSNGHHHRHTSSQASQDQPPPAYDSMLSSQASPPPDVDIDLPAIPSQFEELESLSRDRLEELAADELEFQAFCNRLPLTSEYHDAQRQLLTENAEAAARNLESQVELKDLYDACVSLQQELQTKVQAFQALETKQDAICQPPATAHVCRELTQAKKAALVASERIADDWLESDDCGETTDQFLDAFLEARRVHHTRAAKLELLERQPQQQARPTTTRR